MLLTYEHTDKKLIQLVWVLSSGHTAVLGDVIRCCGIGNVLGLGITAVVLRVSVHAFSGIIKMHCDAGPLNWKGVCINFQCGGPVSRCIYSSPNRTAYDHTDRHKITKGIWTTGQTDRRTYYTDTQGFEI